MASRYRRIAGLLAFLALTVSFAESVWASTCFMPPGSVEMAMDDGTAHDGSERMPCAGHGADAEDHHDDDPCPFDSPGAAQTCVGVVSLPSTSVALPAMPTDGVTAVYPVEARIGLLREAFLFRPPRA